MADITIHEHAVAPQALRERVAQALQGKVQDMSVELGQVVVTVAPADYFEAMQTLRDAEGCRFEQLMDLCGVDYFAYGGGEGRWQGPRYAAVSQLLSVSLNQRLRVRAFCADDEFPVLSSVTPIWSGANWFEREAFDLFGIMFEGHTDLRRILTDYGFVGHPLRKDFPVSGHVEMRYDPQRQRVVYEPVSIEPREVTPHIIREEHYGGLH
jgi:NADH-quinone oxidoreductase subunit C